MDLELQGRRAFVTGAAGQIGRAVVRFLRYEGCYVAGADLAGPPELHGPDMWLTADVRDEGSVREAVAAARERFGGLDLVVGCAGVSGPKGATVPNIEFDDWAQTLAVNLTGQFLLAKHTLPLLREAALADRAPAIVFVSSDAALVAVPDTAAYCASHGGLLMLTKALAVDHGQEGIRINCVAPSPVSQPVTHRGIGPKDGDEPERPYPTHSPADIARSVVLLASPLTATVNGTAFVMDFGGLALSSFEG